MQKAVVLVADAKNFAPAVFVVNRLRSLNCPSDTDLVIVSDSDKDIALASDFGLSCRLVRFDSSLIERSFPVHGHLTQAAYYRVFLPHMLGAEYARILYLDSDTYPQTSTIFGVFDLAMNGFAVGGVQDFWSFLGPASAPPVKPSLNSGVLLLDTRQYLDLQLQERILRIVAESPSGVTMLDQKAINGALAGAFLPVSPSFNMSGPFWTSFVRDVCQPVIVHFAGPIKPWHGPRFSAEHPARAEIERFLPTTRWRSFLAEHFNLEQAMKHISKGGLGPVRVVPHQDVTVLEASRIVNYLKTTEFADVAAGLTTLKLETCRVSHERPAEESHIEWPSVTTSPRSAALQARRVIGWRRHPSAALGFWSMRLPANSPSVTVARRRFSAERAIAFLKRVPEHP